MENGEEDGTILHSLFSRKVARINDRLVVKSGRSLRAHEAPTLRFISANTSIPVPKVHEVRCKDGEIEAIVMDYMPGERLDQAWETMNETQKLFVADQLHGYLGQLRELKGSYIGAVDHGKAIIGNHSVVEGGPFETEREFNDFILSGIVRKAPDLLRHYAKHALFENHEIVFTHADFAPRNILVDESYHVTAILDWEDAGWYPEHWEYIKALRDLMPMPDWTDYLSRILEPRYEQEYIGMSWLGRILRH